ncbi:MAG: extracellular solute-binding protein [Sphaerochaeta sp.]
MKKRIFILFISLFFSMAIFANGAEELNVYCIGDKDLVVPLFNDFSQQTDIVVNLKQTDSLTLPKLLRDGDGWGDIVFGGSGIFHQELASKGSLYAYRRQTDLNSDIFSLSKDNQWIVVDINSLVFVSNNNFLEENNIDPPTSWLDILREEYKDEIVLSNPLRDGVFGRLYNLELIYGMQGAIKFQKELDKNVREYLSNRFDIIKMVSDGDVGFTITDSETALIYAIQGAPITISFPYEGVIFGETCCSILKASDNKSNARTFINWLLSDNYRKTLQDNDIPYIDPKNIESYSDEYIDYSEVKFLKSDFLYKVDSRDKLLSDFENAIIKERSE